MNEIKEKFNNVIDSRGINEIYIGPEEEAPEEAKINVAPNEKGYDELKYRNPETGELDNIYLEPTGDTLPIGFVGAYSGITAPTNWLMCDGSEISRITYSELFNVLGTKYGEGDGSTTFNLPVVIKENIEIELDKIVPTNEFSDGKRIWCKRINLGNLPNATSNNIDTGLTNINFEKTETKAVRTSDGLGIDIPYAATNFLVTTMYVSASNSIRVLSQADMSAYIGTADFYFTYNDSADEPELTNCKVIKAKNSVGLVGNVTNTYSESKQDSYSCDYVNNFVYDTGWQNLTIVKGQAYSDEQIPQIRRIGKTVYMRGALKGYTSSGVNIVQIPTELIPSQAHSFVAPGSQNRVNRFTLNTTGLLMFEQTTATNMAATDWHPISTTYLID